MPRCDKKQAGNIPIVLLICFILGLLFITVFFLQKKGVFLKQNQFFFQKKTTTLDVFSERIPGSSFHSPDATWWGYNQNKIVRFENYVFMYVIENTDNSNKTTSPFVLYKKYKNSPWEKGASFTSSRPGNILIDSKGILHAYVFQPVDVVKNDSWGKLKHYWFPNSASGNITTYLEETVIDNDGTNETVNIRVGSAIGPDDTIAVGFGLTTYNPLYNGHSEHLYIKKPQDKAWQHLIAGENLGHDWYYPFVWATQNNSFHLLPVQDDWNGQGTTQIPYPNIYQKIMYFNYQNGVWSKELIADLSNHPLAPSRPRLLEQEDLYLDTKGTVHILYKEFLDPETQWKTTTHKHIIKNSQGSSEERIDFGKDNINWIRMFEVNNSLYYLYVLYDKAYIRKDGTEKLINLPIPQDAHGMYPYIATKRGGTKEMEEFIDILFLAADQYDYRNKTNVNYYLRIPKSEFTKLDNL